MSNTYLAVSDKYNDINGDIVKQAYDEADEASIAGHAKQTGVLLDAPADLTAFAVVRYEHGSYRYDAYTLEDAAKTQDTSRDYTNFDRGITGFIFASDKDAAQAEIDKQLNPDAAANVTDEAGDYVPKPPTEAINQAFKELDN